MRAIVDAARRPGFVLLALALVLTALQLGATVMFVPHRASIFDIGFGFGGYVRSLAEAGHFAACNRPDCPRASRMPLLPLAYAALTPFTHDQRGIGLIKDAAVTAASGMVVWLGWSVQSRRSARAPWALCVALAALCLAAPLLKHAGGVTYEEGFLACLFPAWLYGLSVLAVSQDGRGEADPARIAWLAGALALVGACCFLLKDSMVVVFGVSLAAVAGVAWRRRSLKLAAFGLLVVLLAAAWPVRNGLVAGRFTPMTSYDGANLERGFSTDGLALYPTLTLDRIYAYPAVTLPDGRRIALEKRPSNFANEWAWNDTYRARAVAWLVSHPWEALRFSLKKAEVFLLDVRKTPLVDPQGREPPLQRWLTSAWLVEGRVSEALFIALSGYLLWRGGRNGRWLAAAAGVGALAYAAPYLVGFAYERHVSVWLGGLTLADAVLFAEVMRLRAEGGPPGRA